MFDPPCAAAQNRERLCAQASNVSLAALLGLTKQNQQRLAEHEERRPEKQIAIDGLLECLHEVARDCDQRHLLSPSKFEINHVIGDWL